MILKLIIIVLLSIMTISEGNDMVAFSPGVKIEISHSGVLPITHYLQNNHQLESGQIRNYFSSIPAISSLAKKSSICNVIGNAFWVACIASFGVLIYDFGNNGRINTVALASYAGSSVAGFGFHIKEDDYLTNAIIIYNQNLLKRYFSANISIENGKISFSF